MRVYSDTEAYMKRLRHQFPIIIPLLLAGIIFTFYTADDLLGGIVLRKLYFQSMLPVSFLLISVGTLSTTDWSIGEFAKQLSLFVIGFLGIWGFIGFSGGWNFLAALPLIIFMAWGFMVLVGTPESKLLAPDTKFMNNWIALGILLSAIFLVVSKGMEHSGEADTEVIRDEIATETHRYYLEFAETTSDGEFLSFYECNSAGFSCKSVFNIRSTNDETFRYASLRFNRTTHEISIYADGRILYTHFNIRID